MSVTQTMSERPKNRLGLVPVLNRWKFPILILCIVAMLGSAGVSLLLTNEYQSTAIFYPTSILSVDPDRILEGEKIEVTGTSVELDRLTTIALSEQLAYFMIYKHKLYLDYGYKDMESDINKFGTMNMFYNNLDVKPNDRDALEISFISHDKYKAAAVANDIVARIDVLNQELPIENRKRVLEIYKNQYDYYSKAYVQLRDSLNKVRKDYGIYGLADEGYHLSKNVIETQAALAQAKGEQEVLEKTGGNTAQLKAKINGLENALATLTNSGSVYNLDKYAAGLKATKDLDSIQSNMLSRYIKAKANYDNAKIALNGKISTINVVQKAEPANRKIKPIRWLIVVGSTVVTFLLCVIFVSLYELYKREAYRFE